LYEEVHDIRNTSEGVAVVQELYSIIMINTDVHIYFCCFDFIITRTKPSHGQENGTRILPLNNRRMDSPRKRLLTNKLLGKCNFLSLAFRHNWSRSGGRMKHSFNPRTGRSAPSDLKCWIISTDRLWCGGVEHDRGASTMSSSPIKLLTIGIQVASSHICSRCNSYCTLCDKSPCNCTPLPHGCGRQAKSHTAPSFD